MDLQFLQQHIVPELQDTNVNDKPILKADAIKFTTTFRNQVSITIVLTAAPELFSTIQIEVQAVTHLMPLLINHLGSNEFVVRSYAAGCIEKVLSVKVGTPAPPQCSSLLDPGWECVPMRSRHHSASAAAVASGSLYRAHSRYGRQRQVGK